MYCVLSRYSPLQDSIQNYRARQINCTLPLLIQELPCSQNVCTRSFTIIYSSACRCLCISNGATILEHLSLMINKYFSLDRLQLLLCSDEEGKPVFSKKNCKWYIERSSILSYFFMARFTSWICSHGYTGRIHHGRSQRRRGRGSCRGRERRHTDKMRKVPAQPILLPLRLHTPPLSDRRRHWTGKRPRRQGEVVIRWGRRRRIHR